MNAEPFRLDLRQARRAFERAARAGQDPAVLQREVEGRMLDRLDYLRLRPARVLDAGCGAGRGLALLGRRFPGAELLGVDFAAAAVSLAVRRGFTFARILSLSRWAPAAWIWFGRIWRLPGRLIRFRRCVNSIACSRRGAC